MRSIWLYSATHIFLSLTIQMVTHAGDVQGKAQITLCLQASSIFCSVFNFDTILLWYGSRERTPYGVSCKLRLSLKFLLYLKCQSLFEAFVWEHDMFPESLCSVFWIKSWQKCHTEKLPSGYLHPFNHPRETWGTYHWWYKRCVLTFQPYWV